MELGEYGFSNFYISHYKKNINQIFDNDPAKLNHNFPEQKEKYCQIKKFF